HHPDRQLFELTKHGLSKLAGGEYKTRMPKYDGILSDKDIAAVLSFIKSRWPERVRKRHDQLNAAAEK
ncbi:MAG: cytochrome c, partial [Hyphomicrobiales bacterium]|nr:cytochrome c [Hyphomicrobiales bacterium]